MSAATQISPISEGAPARSDSDAGSAECSLSHSDSAGLESSPAVRRHLPDEQRALTHHFSIAGQEGYLTVGVYEDGLPGEIFITMAKQGSTISGLMDSFATAVEANPRVPGPTAGLKAHMREFAAQHVKVTRTCCRFAGMIVGIHGRDQHKLATLENENSVPRYFVDAERRIEDKRLETGNCVTHALYRSSLPRYLWT